MAVGSARGRANYGIAPASLVSGIAAFSWAVAAVLKVLKTLS